MISPECSVCMELHKPVRESGSTKREDVEDASVLRDLSEAIATIEDSATFPLLMPEVSVNIAMSRPSPKLAGMWQRFLEESTRFMAAPRHSFFQSLDALITCLKCS